MATEGLDLPGGHILAQEACVYGETVQWKCLCAKWTEGMVNIGQIQLRNGFNVQLRSTGLLPIMVDRANEDYENIVRKYNYRHLI